VTKVNCSTSFILVTRSLKIIWYARLTRLSIYPGFAENLHLTIRRWRPSIDPELMIRMLVVGYVFAIRSERLLCREVQVNLAYRWFCKLGIEDAIPDHSVFSRARNERFREGGIFRHVFERVVEACIASSLVGGEGFAVDASLIQADANKQRSIAGQDWRASPCPWWARRCQPTHRFSSLEQ
jgi:transposase